MSLSPMNQYVISVMSRDRVGIVYDVASRVSALRGDIADLRQSVLRGHFTMILLASFPSEISAAEIEHRLAEIDGAGEAPLKIAVLPADGSEGEQAVGPQNIYVLTAHGGDRIGFVATVASFCAEHAINILDLATAIDDGQYTMMLQVDLSHTAPLSVLQRQLRQFADQHAMHVVLQHNDIFQATHEITMPR